MVTQFRLRDGWHFLRDILQRRDDFTISTGNLWGEATKYVNSYGRLPDPWDTYLRQCESNGSLQYVIYSYATPIAWFSNGVWTMPDVSYSKTTTKQQLKVRVAIDNLEAIAA